jgi:hypothetical protein
VLADERVAIAEGHAERRHGGRIARVPEDHGDVAEEAAAPRSRERGVAEAATKRARIEAEQVGEEREEAVAVGGARRRRRRVPRADLLADVAPEDPGTEGAPEFAWDRPTVLDGQVRDAASCIHDHAIPECGGGTRLETERARRNAPRSTSWRRLGHELGEEATDRHGSRAASSC